MKIKQRLPKVVQRKLTKNHSQSWTISSEWRNNILKKKKSKFNLKNNSRKKKLNHLLKHRKLEIKGFSIISLVPPKNKNLKIIRIKVKYKHQELVLKNSTTKRQDKLLIWPYNKHSKIRHSKNKVKKRFKTELQQLFKSNWEWVRRQQVQWEKV